MNNTLAFLLLGTPLAFATPQLLLDTDTLLPETTLRLSFAKAVVAPEAVGKNAENTFLAIEPALEGELKWTAPEVAEFRLSSLPQLGQTYTFTMREGQVFADGSPIEAGELKTVPAPAFQQVRMRRSGSGRLPGVYILFNDAVAPASTTPYFSYRDDSGQSVAAAVRQGRWAEARSISHIGPTWQQRSEGWQAPEAQSIDADTEIPTALFVTPAAPLPIGTNWQLHLSPGLPNASLTAVAEVSSSHWAGSVGATKVSEIEAVTAVDAPRHLRITFNKSLPKDTTYEQLRDFIRIDPQPENFAMTLNNSRRTLRFDGDFSTRSGWKVEVREGLTPEDGLPLEASIQKDLVFRNLAPRLAVASEDQSQLATGSRTYEIETVNLASVRMRIKHLKGDDAVRAFQGYRHYSGDGPGNESLAGTNPLPFELLHGTTLTDQTFPLKADFDRSEMIRLNWKDYLPENDPFALLFVSLEGAPKPGLDTTEAKPVVTQAFVQLTDIGLAWKINDDEAFLYAYSCETGRPLPHVKLDLFGEDSTPLEGNRTDADGVARLPRSPEARHLRATWGDDTVLVAFDESLPTVTMWRFPVRFAWDYEKGMPRHVLLFTDRSLYRPSETVHLKGLVRNLTGTAFQHDPKTNPQLTIRDSANRIILEQAVILSERGSFDHSFPLPAETVGRFSATLTWPDEEEAATALENWAERYSAERNARFTHGFRVEEFRRNAYEVESTLATTPEPGKLQLTLDAKYYQGQPVAKGAVKWYLNDRSIGFYPDRYRDYLFGDHRSYDSYYWSHYFGYTDNDYYGSRSNSRNGAVQLDDSGHAELALTLPDSDFPSPRKVSVTSEVTDARNQTLASTAMVTLHSSDLYLGVSRQDQLIRTGDTIALQVVAVRKDGTPAEIPVTAELSLSREYNEQVKIKAANGRISVRNEERHEELGKQTIAIQPAAMETGGLVVPFTPQKPGRHTLTFSGTDAAGHAFRTSTVLHVYGGDEYPWAYENGMKIRLVPEKPNYRPGETARILVLSPIEGTALITLEREGVQSHFVRELRGNDPVIEIPLDEGHAPNVFASVLVIKGARDNKREVKEPLLRLGYCELRVENVQERLAVSLEIPGDYHRPGEEVTVSGLITTSTGEPAANAEVTLYAEDEGTLAVMGYRNPDPMAHFYAPRQLRTKAGTSLDNFISESPENRNFFNKGFFIGGGDGDYFDELADIEVRENFTPCAHWAPTLVTGPDGRFSATFQSPDTLTRYRVIAVAHEGTGRFGSASAEFVVNKPLMLEPSVPRFASEGDTLHPKVLVQNSTEHAGTWEVSLQLDSITRFLEGEDRLQSKTITLPAKGSMAVSFDVAFADTGTTDWIWSARPVALTDSATTLTPELDRELTDAVVSRFEVSYPMPLLRETRFVRFEEPQQRRNLLDGLSPQLLNGRGTLELQFGKSLLLEAGGAIDFLLHYPYGCVEQTTSSTIPWIAARNLRGLSPQLAKHSDSEVNRSIQAGANRLLSMQTGDGGLAYWPGGRESEEWASAYGGMAILLCKEAGAEVPGEAVAKLADYLAGTLKQLDAKTEEWDREILTRACFVLAMAGKPQEPVHNRLLDEVATLNGNARCFLALAIHQTGGEGSLGAAQRLLDLPDEPSNKASNHWMQYQPRDAYRLLATSRIRPSDAEPIIDKLLATRNEQGHWYTTWGNAWSLFALGDHATRSPGLDEPVTIDLLTAEGPRQIILDRDHRSASVSLPLHSGLQATVSTSAQAYVRCEVAAKPQVGDQPAVSKGGFQIARTYHRVLPDGSTEPLQEPKVGDLLMVELEVEIPSDNSRYVVIDDALPSLFEAVNTDFASQAGAVKRANNGWQISHQELRDDRAVFFLNHVWKRGNYKVRYYARVTSAGEAVAPPAKVEAMYNPQAYALSASRTFQTPNPLTTAAR